MHEMGQSSRLRDEPLTSRDDRHMLDYDDSGIATLTDSGTGEIRWRADVSGRLLLGDDGVLQVPRRRRRVRPPRRWTAGAIRRRRHLGVG